MICKNCGKEIEENEKFCFSCGTAVENDDSAQSAPPQSIESLLIEPETIQKKKWGLPEKILLAVSGFELFHAAGMLLNREAMIFGTYSYNLSAASESFIIAAVCLAIAMIIHYKRKLTDHYKYKCPYCNEENTVVADTTSTFKCSKCKKTMTIIDQKIKTID